MNRRSTMIAALSAAIALAVPFGSALAAAPANDDIASPTVITGLPYANSQDTSEATSGSTDVDCAGGAHSVWYEYTAIADGRLEANTFGSDFDTTLAVGTADGAGGVDVIACNDDWDGVQSRIRWDITGGTTYLLQAGSFATGAGGNLVLNVDAAPPFVPVLLELTINPMARVDRNGIAMVSGTLSCEGADEAELAADLRQQFGRFVLNGSAWDSVDCSTTPAPWQLQLLSPDGKFAGGRASVRVATSACNSEECNWAEVERTITLTK